MSGVYQTENFTRAATLHGHGDTLNRVLWTPGGPALVSLGTEGDIKVRRTR